MEENKKYVYVCLSECKNIVKVGITYSIKERLSGLKTDQKQEFKLMFCSEAVNVSRAKEIETLVNTKFKDQLIKGNEWYNVKPINIIEYLIDELELMPFQIKESYCRFEVWEEDFSSYKSYKEGTEFPLIREKPTNGLYCICYLTGSEIHYIEFCNYGDAKDFYFRYKHFVLMADYLVFDLYGVALETYKFLILSPRKDIYNIRKKIREVRDKLLQVTDI